jgi:hypothetical protein
MFSRKFQNSAWKKFFQLKNKISRWKNKNSAGNLKVQLEILFFSGTFKFPAELISAPVERIGLY